MEQRQKSCTHDGYNEEKKLEENQLHREWEKRCKEEEIYGDKSRVQWLKVGEKNTKFFHESTTAHRNHNKILKIRDHKGKELESHKEIENARVHHFQDIAKEIEVDRSEAIQRIMRHIQRLVTEDHNQNLRKPPKEVD